MLGENISDFLAANGFECKIIDICGTGVIRICPDNGIERFILPISVNSDSIEKARIQADQMRERTERLTAEAGQRPLIITEDRWKSQDKMMKDRLLAHLEVFFPVFARNCEIKKIDKAEASAFLEANHSYGDAACRYRYGMFLKRHTGQRSGQFTKDDREGLKSGTLVAVAEFSNARKWIKGDKVIRSYEWTRYASLAGIRINGGMGKILSHFIKEVQPDDIMSYADLEWSEGAVYEQLGFTLEGHKEAVDFSIDTKEWKRTAIRPQNGSMTDIRKEGIVYLRNFGSNKYRLKLTDYE